MNFKSIFEAFGLSSETTATPFGSGLINSTFLLIHESEYILQKINTQVFSKPNIIAQNVRNCSNFLQENHPDYLFITPIKTVHGQEYFIDNGNYWRLTPYIDNSCSYDQLTKPQLAFEAAKAVGEFAKVTSATDISSFGETIPNFHNLSFRYWQFQEALEKGNPIRVQQQKAVIDEVISLSHICDTFEEIKTNPEIPIRIQHHDTKINNILFDKGTEKSICLCDLDTLMPGYFISDLGDMMRTYLSEANEEEKNFNLIKARREYYDALMEGYLSQMENTLTAAELKYLHYSGEFLIYMQAVRFLTDYLNDDIYYAITYPEQNLNRTLNQLRLLSSYQKLN